MSYKEGDEVLIKTAVGFFPRMLVHVVGDRGGLNEDVPVSINSRSINTWLTPGSRHPERNYVYYKLNRVTKELFL